MPLSGAAMISENTAAASFRRFTGSLSLASNGVNTNAASIVNLIFHLFWSTGSLHGPSDGHFFTCTSYAKSCRTIQVQDDVVRAQPPKRSRGGGPFTQ